MRSSLESQVGGGDKTEDSSWERLWNANNHRVAAQAALICGATPHVAHLVHWKSDFATRDVPGQAKIHPSSVNFDHSKRAHWYLYSELRSTRQPYLHITTAVSPLELALFSDSSVLDLSHDNEVHDDENLDGTEGKTNKPSITTPKDNRYDNVWSFIVDQWVPVDVAHKSQRETFLQLKGLLMHDMLQQVAGDPKAFLENEDFAQLILHVLAAIEHQRIQT